MVEKTIKRQFRIAGQPFVLRATEVVRAMLKVDPEPIASHYVVVDRRRFPPKQVISEVTGLDRADFTTHQARRTLMRLGFVAGRKRPGLRTDSKHRFEPQASGSAIESDQLVDRLQPLAGQWVAIKGGDLLHSAATARDLVRWLARHDQRADSMFRVPEDAVASSGFAPL